MRSQRIVVLFAAVLFVTLAQVVFADIFFRETFDSLDRWTESKSRPDYGQVKLGAGAWYGDAKLDQGLQASQDARHYSLSAPFDKVLESNKDKNLVLQYSFKWGQDGIDCGGGYLKLLPRKSLDGGKQAEFNGDTEYSIMFGPDVCGATKRIHLIFNYKGKNLLWKKSPMCETDKLTHVYTAVIRPDNTYEVLVDGNKKESGSLFEDWDFLEAKEIDDPEDKKPADWVDDREIDDPESQKPEDWDKEPKFIADPEAKKPEDWNDEEDGEWQAPSVPNPNHKGEWIAKRIPNPAYKGEWHPKRIANPNYVEDNEVYKHEDLGHAGIEIWTVKGGQIYDNILVTDDVELAAKERESVLERAKKEKEEFDRIQEERRKKDEEERKKQEEKDEEERKKRQEEEDAQQKKESENAEEADKAAEESTATATAEEEEKKDVKDEL